MLDTPGGNVLPPVELRRRPANAFILVAPRTRIWNFVRARHGRRNESEGVAADARIRQCLLDLRHMTCDAFIAPTAGFVMSMLFDGAGVRAIGRAWTMAFQAHHVGRLYQERFIVGSVYIVATEALYSMRIHHALHKIVTLHPVLMRCAVGKVHKVCLAERVLFELPVILQLLAHVETYGPIVVFAFDRVL